MGGLAGTGGAAGAGAGGLAGAGQAGAAGAGDGACVLGAWPTPSSTESVTETIEASGMFDGGMKRYVGAGPLGTSGQNEDQGAIFRLAPGTIMKNVILGNPAADGIHCDGSCTLQNVFWEDVGEDAATLDGTDPSQTMIIECSRARSATDKIFQHNGPGTMIIRRVAVESFNRLYRSCGNCLVQYTRHGVLEDILAIGGNSLAGVNQNYDDTVDFTRIIVEDEPPMGGTTICQRFQGNDTGAETRVLGEGPDPDHCRYEESDITRR